MNFRLPLSLAMCFIGINLFAQLGNNPGFYDFSYSYKKVLFRWDLNDLQATKKFIQSSSKYNTTISNGVLYLEALTDSGIEWGFNSSKLDLYKDWEIETSIILDKAVHPTIYFNRTDSFECAVYITSSNTVSTVYSPAVNVKQGIEQITYKFYSITESNIFTIRKTGEKIILFINHEFIGYFPDKCTDIKSSKYGWGIDGKGKLAIKSLELYQVSNTFQDEFIKDHPAAQLNGINESQKKLVFMEDFNDNKNRWSDKYCYEPSDYDHLNIKNSFLKIGAGPVILYKVINPNTDFEIETNIPKAKDWRSFSFCVDSCGNSGIESLIHADYSYSTIHPIYYYDIKVDEFPTKQQATLIYLKNDNGTKFMVRKSGDILYFFCDDRFIYAMHPLPKLSSGLRFHTVKDETMQVDYVKVSEIK